MEKGIEKQVKGKKKKRKGSSGISIIILISIWYYAYWQD